jgi:hypothetical protein
MRKSYRSFGHGTGDNAMWEFSPVAMIAILTVLSWILVVSVVLLLTGIF